MEYFCLFFNLFWLFLYLFWCILWSSTWQFLNNFIKDVCKFLTQHKRQDLDFIISWNFLCIFDTEWNVHWILFVLFFRWKKTDWYLVPSYFVIKVELSNCKHKSFTVFYNFKKWIGRIIFHLRNFEKDMKKNALNTLWNFVTMTIVELDTKFIMTILKFFTIMMMTNIWH